MKIIYTAIFLLVAWPVCAKDLGVVGTTYPIVERDAIEEIMEKARQVDWGKVVDKSKMTSAIKRFKPGGIKNLPRASGSRTFQVDMTYSLEADITDKAGRVLYPKGFTFNPLDYVHNPGTVFVVINGADREQVSWFKKSRYANDMNVTLMLTDGSYYELSRELKRPVFYAVHGIIERFGLEYVPSVIQQKGRIMEVREVDVDKVYKHHS